jgi:hypothetical protein
MSPPDGGDVAIQKPRKPRVRKKAADVSEKRKESNRKSQAKHRAKQKALLTAARARSMSAGHGNAVVLIVLFLLCCGAVAGSYVMAADTLRGMFPGIGAYVRALGLVGCECAFGHFCYALFKARRGFVGGCCAAVVILAALAEMGLASAQGEIAMRSKQDAILAKTDTPASFVEAPLKIDGGPTKTAEVLAAMADARHEAATEAAANKARRLALATQQTWLEAYLPVILAMLGAMAAACCTPILEMLLSGVRRK